MDSDIPVFSVVLENEDILRVAYMPYLKNGGLFIATTQKKALGELVRVKMSLLGETPIEFVGRVAWITPDGAQGHRPAGIGVQFETDDAEKLRSKIEKALKDKLQSDLETDTL
jgi:type IV pilus assembly protein PilZ